jgi:dolichol-phosphate mannosyltransferase
MKLSVVIPANNEQECIEQVVLDICSLLVQENIPYEIILVDDNSTDHTGEIAEKLSENNPAVRVIHRTPPRGFGRAIKEGLEHINGEVVVICMGDASDEPKDIVRYYRKILEGYDCIFGSRFIPGATVRDYPPLKLFLNRLANTLIRIMFLIRENDITNAFKAYRREVIESVKPLVSNHFNITIEIPLKAINRSFKHTMIPINWNGRKSGVSKLKLRELQKKYLFTLLYVWLEKILLKDEIKEHTKNEI